MIAALGHRDAIRADEALLIVEILLDAKAALVYQRVQSRSSLSTAVSPSFDPCFTWWQCKIIDAGHRLDLLAGFPTPFYHR